MTQTSPPEAPLVEAEAGLKPDGEEWFVVNVSESVAIASEDAGHAWPFEDPAHRFPHFGLNVHVLQPGEPACKYHAEEAQEGFLVLQGECVLVVGDEERRLRQWDFFHAPPWTPHVPRRGGHRPVRGADGRGTLFAEGHHLSSQRGGSALWGERRSRDVVSSRGVGRLAATPPGSTNVAS